MISDPYGPIFEIKLYLLGTAPQELWNALSKSVPGKYLRSGEPSKQDCLQDRANFHRSQAWQFAFIFNTTPWYPIIKNG